MAFLQINEPGQNKETQDVNEIVVGIDLGTTNSLVAIIENEKVKLFKDENGRDIHHSLVAYDTSGKLAGVGNSAKGKFLISSVKRLMGKSFSDVKDEKFHFEIEENNSEKESLKILVGNRKISPEEVSAEILKYLKNLAEKKLKTEIKKAVITVPAYFDEAAKNATKLAANLAGLEVLRLVNEPTAAALAYGLDNSSEGIYCVYDLGGGTFDVSILKMQRGVFKVLGVAGDNHLGGDDFDKKILEKFPRLNIFEARKIKEKLSEKQAVEGLTRIEFEDLISSKIEKTFTLTKNLIEDLELEIDEIKGVILVGGSTRIPLVRKKLSEIFGEKKILINLDPDRVVGIGAAWQAYNLSGSGNNLLLDVTALSLGIEMMGGIVEKIIPRHNSIPTALAKEFTTYADNQTGMKLHIVQGERGLGKDCRSLAEFEIKNIPPMKAGLARILITFKLDADGLLTVAAEEKLTGEKQEITVKPSYSLDENEIKKMLLDSLKNSQSDMEKRLLIEAITEATQDALIIETDLQNLSHLISKSEKKLIEEKLKILEKLISEKTSRDAILLAQQELGKSAENLVLQKVNSVLKEKVTGKKIDEI
jgi:molecular chaperone HscA